MPTITEITERDGWLIDQRGNKNSISYWGSLEAAEKALRSLVDCNNCVNCSRCSRCSGKIGDATGEAVVIPTIENIDQAVYAAASQPEALDMGNWHCGTAHCRAGWVVTLAGEQGKALEDRFNTELAAMLIYRESGSPINPGRFYGSNDAALADMAKRAGVEL